MVEDFVNVTLVNKITTFCEILNTKEFRASCDTLCRGVKPVQALMQFMISRPASAQESYVAFFSYLFVQHLRLFIWYNRFHD